MKETIDVFAGIPGPQQQQVRLVQSKTEEAIGRLQNSEVRDGRSLSQMLDETEQKLADVVNRKASPEELAEINRQILSSDLKSVRDSVEQEEKDLQMAIYGMSTLLQQLGEGYAKLGEENPEDLAMISHAESEVKRLEGELAVAKAMSNFLWKRDKAVARLEPLLQKAIERVPEVKEEAKRRARQRLQSASIEEALLEYQSRVDLVLQIMHTSRANAVDMLNVVGERKAQTFAAKTHAMEALEQWGKLLAEAEAKVQEEEAKLSSFQNGTQAYSEQENAIAAARKSLEDARNQHNNALVQSNSKTEYAEELQLDEVALKRLLGNLEAWIIHLTSAAEERIVTFQARLAAEKLLSDQEVAAELDIVGAEIDSRNRTRMASITVAADKARQGMMASLPARREKLAAVLATFAQHSAEARERDAEFLRQFQESFGLDPLASSEFARSN